MHECSAWDVLKLYFPHALLHLTSFEDYTRRWTVVPAAGGAFASASARNLDFPQLALQMYGIDVERFVYEQVRQTW